MHPGTFAVGLATKETPLDSVLSQVRVRLRLRLRSGAAASTWLSTESSVVRVRARVS